MGHRAPGATQRDRVSAGGPVARTLSAVLLVLVAPGHIEVLRGARRRVLLGGLVVGRCGLWVLLGLRAATDDARAWVASQAAHAVPLTANLSSSARPLLPCLG